MNASRTRQSQLGFTLIEALLSVALMGIVLAALALLTAQWFPNWNRGFRRVQQIELIGLGLERAVADISAAEFVSPNGKTKKPLFEGSELSMVFVRSALGPNTAPGLDIVRLSEMPTESGLALVRTRAKFTPLAPGMQIGSQVAFSDPVVLTQGPFRLSFSYAGIDRAWQPMWHDATQLPRAVKLIVRSTTTGQVVMVSTAIPVHVTSPAACTTKSPRECLERLNKPEQPEGEQTL
ncbi:MAG: prepilin-type N-terminal cleavage/methylation domain-containing protein [Methylobacteriaceae bacterium]|nr:prepilin-type N-terminal cleavage/methylation domain-containing protein [Methylobacteriaceae bacterium]